jgi:anti-anti-sigma factor
MAKPQKSVLPDAVERLGEVSVDYDVEETLIRLAGEVDQALVGCLDFAQEQAIKRDLPVRIDVSAVTFMDSTGLALIVRVAAAERTHGRRVRVEGVVGQVDELLHISGLDRLVICSP